VKEAHNHHRVTPEGRAAGEQTARLVEKAIQKLEAEGEPDERCKTCAFRAGTVPNGCPQTQSDAMKAGMEGVPFMCHQRINEDGKHTTPCHGWYAMRVALKGAVIKAPWEFSPPDDEEVPAPSDAIDNLPVMILAGDDDRSRHLANAMHEQAIKNVHIVGATLSLGLPVDAAFLLGAKPLIRPANKAPALTQADIARMDAAEAKRQRKAAKRRLVTP
jgi:hypothetical protein